MDAIMDIFDAEEDEGSQIERDRGKPEQTSVPMTDSDILVLDDQNYDRWEEHRECWRATRGKLHTDREPTDREGRIVFTEADRCVPRAGEDLWPTLAVMTERPDLYELEANGLSIGDVANVANVDGVIPKIIITMAVAELQDMRIGGIHRPQRGQGESQGFGDTTRGSGSWSKAQSQPMVEGLRVWGPDQEAPTVLQEGEWSICRSQGDINMWYVRTKGFTYRVAGDQARILGSNRRTTGCPVAYK